MRHGTLLELAARDGIALPDSLVSGWPPQLSAADEKGWFRFQRLYDVARSVLRTEDDVRRLVREAAEDDAADGGGWLEIQVDPSGYAARFGGHHRLPRPGPRRRPRGGGGHRGRDRGGGRGQPHPAPAGRAHPGAPRRAVRRARRGRLRAVQRRAARHHHRLRGRLRHRGARRPAAAAARRRAARPRARADLPGRAAPGPPRPRRALGRGPRPARPGRRRGHRAGGLPGLQRLARRLLRPVLRAGADAARGRRHGRPGLRRPAALRLAAGRAVRHHARRARPRRRRPGGAGPDVGHRQRGPRRRAVPAAGRDRRLAGHAGLRPAGGSDRAQRAYPQLVAGPGLLVLPDPGGDHLEGAAGAGRGGARRGHARHDPGRALRPGHLHVAGHLGLGVAVGGVAGHGRPLVRHRGHEDPGEAVVVTVAQPDHEQLVPPGVLRRQPGQVGREPQPAGRRPAHLEAARGRCCVGSGPRDRARRGRC
ncbi:hypothetical protein L7F22_016461 [Adiantum nelumboides]|nr:hypothetical protein [Adiantum nelumboides]